MKTVITAGLLLTLTTGIALADGAKGKKLHDAQCLKCHDTSVYTRPKHFINNRDALKNRSTAVIRMSAHNGLTRTSMMLCNTSMKLSTSSNRRAS